LEKAGGTLPTDLKNKNMKKINHNSFLSISFSKGFTSPNIPIATFYQGDKELNFIIDTGSDDNVINRDALSDIKYDKIEHQGTLAGVGGVYQVEACNISFQYEGENFTTKFLISDHLKEAFDNIRSCHAIPLHGMLGSKFLMSNNIVLDFNNLVAYNKKNEG
jgi:predicted aspartyl protease